MQVSGAESLPVPRTACPADGGASTPARPFTAAANDAAAETAAACAAAAAVIAAADDDAAATEAAVADGGNGRAAVDAAGAAGADAGAPAPAATGADSCDAAAAGAPASSSRPCADINEEWQTPRSSRAWRRTRGAERIAAHSGEKQEADAHKHARGSARRPGRKAGVSATLGRGSHRRGCRRCRARAVNAHFFGVLSRLFNSMPAAPRRRRGAAARRIERALDTGLPRA